MEKIKMTEFKSFSINYMFFIIAVIISIAYIATSFLAMGMTGLSAFDILQDGFLFLLLNIVVGNMLAVQGLVKGNKTPEVQDAKQRKKSSKIAIKPYMSDFENFCNKKNFNALKIKREEILSAEGLAYDSYFDELGRPKEQDEFIPESWIKRVCKSLFGEKTYEEQRNLARHKAFGMAKKTKIKKITPNLIMADGKAKASSHGLDVSTEGYLLQFNTLGVVAKIATVFVFGIYAVDVATNFSWADFIWRSLQVIVIFAFGFLAMHRGYNFMRIRYSDKLNEQSDIMDEFYSLQGIVNPALAKPTLEEALEIAKEHGIELEDETQQIIKCG